MENGIVLKHLDNYYPQGNGLADSTNKKIICIINKTLLSHQIKWHNVLTNAMWDDCVTLKCNIPNLEELARHDWKTHFPIMAATGIETKTWIP